MKTEKTDCFVSVVIVVHNNASILQGLLTRLEKLLRSRFTDFEILIINWRSFDNTEAIMEDLLQNISSIRYIKLSENTMYDTAWLAGMENAIGDFVITLHPETDPIEDIPALIEKSMNGADIVVGISKNIRKSFFYRIIHPLVRKFIRYFAKINLPINATLFGVYSRRSINAIFQASNKFKPLEVRIATLGYSVDNHSYALIDRKKYPKRRINTEIKRGIKIFVFSSLRPLRFISVIGILSSIASMLIALYSIIVKIIKEDVEPGWASMVFIMSIYFTMMFTMLFFLFEYFGRLFEERGVDQQYSIVSERNSSVMFANERFNVLHESESEKTNKVQTGRNK